MSQRPEGWATCCFQPKPPRPFYGKAIIMPLCLALVTASAYAGIPTISNTADLNLTIGAPATFIAPEISFADGGSYTDGSITFSLASATSDDALAIAGESDPDANGAISVSGSDIFVGNGSGRNRVGSIDTTLNGQAGAALKILFSSPLENSSFEDGTTAGWAEFAQAFPDAAALDGSSIPWVRSSDGSSIPWVRSSNSTSGTASILNATTSNMTYSISVVTTPVSSGTYALQLLSSGTVTCTASPGAGNPDGYCSTHGPYLESSPFEAFSGDEIYLDWAAQNGGDWYEALGYLIGAGPDNVFGTGDDTETLLFSQRGDTKAFSTETTSVSTTGTYKFRFVSGSYDYSGGYALGASLYVDNVRVVSGTPLTDAIALNIARRVTFQNTAENPPTSRELEIAVVTEDGGTDTATLDVNFSAPPPPVIEAVTERVKSKNSGGSAALGFLPALALLLFRRFKSGARAAATKAAVLMAAIATLSTVSTPGHAEPSILDKFSLTLQGMHVDAGDAADRFHHQTNVSGLVGDIKTGDDKRFGYGVTVNYRVNDAWQLSAGYLDLGEADTSITADSTSVDAFLSSVRDIRMQTGSGLTLGTGYLYDLGSQWSVTANAGLFFWKADMDFDGSSHRRKVSESDQDLFFGGGVSYRVIAPLALGLGWQRYRLDGSNLDAFYLSATYHLGAGLN